MRQIRSKTHRISIITCVTFASLTASSYANAQCTGTNTCYGTQALQSITSGVENTAIGYQALLNNTFNAQNTAIGYLALATNNGQSNTAVGSNALFSNTTGELNTASGTFALYLNSTGDVNTAFGSYAMYNNSTGIRNTACGGYALFANTTGINNTASGQNALAKNKTGSSNTATGVHALYNNTSGYNNSAFGQNSLSLLTTGYFNTAVGNQALRNATTGYRNVALGRQAGLAVTGGSDNIILGSDNFGLAGESGVIRIGSGTYQSKAFIAGIRGVQTGMSGAVPVLIDASGQLGTINSSRRFKEDIQPIGSVSERLFSLRPVAFHYKQPFDNGSKPLQFGLIAEDVAKVFPELVIYGKDGLPETVAYHTLSTLLLNELQKERAENAGQAARIRALEAKVDDLVILVGSR